MITKRNLTPPKPLPQLPPTIATTGLAAPDQKSATRQKRSPIRKCRLSLVALLLGGGLALTACSGQSKAYTDGQSIGKQMAISDESNGSEIYGAAGDCQFAAGDEDPNDFHRQSGDNIAQWTAGCIAAYKAVLKK